MQKKMVLVSSLLDTQHYGTKLGVIQMRLEAECFTPGTFKKFGATPMFIKKDHLQGEKLRNVCKIGNEKIVQNYLQSMEAILSVSLTVHPHHRSCKTIFTIYLLD